MDDFNYELQRQTNAMERQNRELEQQNYELARQNQLAEVQARIDLETYELQRNHYVLQHQQTERQIELAGMQLEATQGVVDATNNVADATNNVAEIIERGQRAWAEVEMAKLQRRQKKDESKEFSHAQEHKIYALWARLPELNEPATPGAEFMRLKGMRDELADIAIDAVHDIAFLDRDNETKKKIGDALMALVCKYPELVFIATDYDDKIALAKRLQEQSCFHTFEETTLAGRLKMLQEKYPELNRLFAV